MKIFPNFLKAHLIVNFSRCICQKVYEGEYKAKSEAEIIRRIRAEIEYSAEILKKNFEGITAKFNKIDHYSVLADL
jgi:hypothetical protein